MDGIYTYGDSRLVLTAVVAFLRTSSWRALSLFLPSRERCVLLSLLLSRSKDEVLSHVTIFKKVGDQDACCVMQIDRAPPSRASRIIKKRQKQASRVAPCM